LSSGAPENARKKRFAHGRNTRAEVFDQQVQGIVESKIWESKGGSLSMNLNPTVVGDERQAIGLTSPLPWFAVRVRSNYEKPVSAVLRGKGFEEFVPTYRAKRQWSDRIKVIDLPLFPGYLFCRLDLNKRLPLLTTPGFLYLVGKGKMPEPVDEGEILAIQSVLRSGIPALPWPSVIVGQKVRLERGPLRGVEGVVDKIADQHRIFVNVTLLQRSVSVQVDPDWIRSVGGPSSILAA
jgi:transcription antitermination factor NusG